METLQFLPEQLDGFEVNRSYGGRIQCQKEDELYRALALTHTVFNEKVAEVCRQIFKVLNDQSNPEFAKLTRWAIQNISPAGQCSTHFANPFTLESSRANPTHKAYDKQPEMRELFLLCKERGDRWYNRTDVFGSLIEGRSGGSGMVAEVNQAAIEKISAYLSLMNNWRKGKHTPLYTLKDAETFEKKVLKFIKAHHDLLSQEWEHHFQDGSKTPPAEAELYHDLLFKPDRERKKLLQMIFREKLNYAWLIEVLDGLYQSYQDEALGKENWLKQKQYFEKNNSKFKEEYDRLLKASDKVFSKKWFKDPNFLALIDREGSSLWNDFQSPLKQADFQKEWNELRTEKPGLPEKPWDDRKGRELFVKALKQYNPKLFEQNGWFRLFERSLQLQSFARPPQFRYPDPFDHPEWINISDQGCFQYRNARVTSSNSSASLEITVNLVDPETKTSWKAYALPITLDRRLKTLSTKQTVQVPKGRWAKDQRIFEWEKDEDGNPLYKEDEFYRWMDPDGVIQWIQLHGGNLMFKNDAFYLQFRYTYKTAKKPKLRDEVNKESQFNYLPGTRLLLVDQGQKADAVVAIMELTEAGELKLVRFNPFNFKPHKEKKKRKDGKPFGKTYFQWIKLPGGIGFRAISHAEKVRSGKVRFTKRRETNWLDYRTKKGDPLPSKSSKTQGRFLSRNQVFCKSLKNYIEHCRQLHYKTLAGVLCKLAKDNHCKGIVIEDLKSYRTTLKQERFENKRLMVWSVQKKTAFLEMLCDSAEINILKKSAAYTSQTCNRCGSWGVRFNIPTKKEWSYYQQKGIVSAKEEQLHPVISPGGDWFICSNPTNCNQQESENTPQYYRIQADANAAKNLGIRAFLREGWGATPPQDKVEKKHVLDTLQKWLIEEYRAKNKAKISRPLATV